MSGKENREIKNSVFVDLFYEDESAEANEIDISFDVGGKVIVFGEHQSTINENMPLRSLLYIGRAYEQIVPIRDRYKRKLVPLPTPEFYTLKYWKNVRF